MTFAGYKFPHPLDYHILIKVQTKGKKSPREVMDDALTDLCDEFEDIRAKFQVGLILCLSRRIWLCLTMVVRQRAGGRIGHIWCSGAVCRRRLAEYTAAKQGQDLSDRQHSR